MGQLARRLLSGRAHLGSFLQAVASPTTGDKLWVWSSSAKANRVLARDGLLGPLNEPGANPTLISLNNAGGNKLDAYIDVRNMLNVCSRPGKTTNQHLVVQLTNTAPEGGLPAYTSPRLDLPTGQRRPVGSNRDLVTVYLPRGASLSNFTIDGAYSSAGDYMDSGREILVFDLDTNPGRRHRLVLDYQVPSSHKTEQPSDLLASSAAFGLEENSVTAKGCGHRMVMHGQ